MKKILKVNKTLIVLGIIVLVSVISFFGLYQKVNGIWKDLLPKYNLGMELAGYRELQFSLDTTEEEKEVYVDENGNILGLVEDGTASKQDTSVSLVEGEEAKETAENANSEYKTEKRVIKANEEADITIENFELSKEIIQNRLKSLNNLEYNIRVDNITGNLVLEVLDDENLLTAEALINSKGTFDVIDYQNGIKLLDNKDISNVKVLANYEEEGYQLYLQILLNDTSKEKISEISKKYVKTTNEAGEASTQYVAVRFEGQILLTTYFGEEITNGTLTIPIGNPTNDSKEYMQATEQANRIAFILNAKQLPLKYTLTSDSYIKSTITEEITLIAEIVLALVILVISALLIVKFKLNGAILSVVAVGFSAITLLLLRYANVPITLNSVYTLIACIALNYVFTYKLLKNLKEKDLKTAFVQTMKEYYLLIVPAIVFAVVFTLASAVPVNSIGMTLFWGLLTQIIYNSLIIFVLKLV